MTPLTYIQNNLRLVNYKSLDETINNFGIQTTLRIFFIEIGYNLISTQDDENVFKHQSISHIYFTFNTKVLKSFVKDTCILETPLTDLNFDNILSTIRNFWQL